MSREMLILLDAGYDCSLLLLLELSRPNFVSLKDLLRLKRVLKNWSCLGSQMSPKSKFKFDIRSSTIVCSLQLMPDV
jgi:hypothetical protein